MLKNQKAVDYQKALAYLMKFVDKPIILQIGYAGIIRMDVKPIFSHNYQIEKKITHFRGDKELMLQIESPWEIWWRNRMLTEWKASENKLVARIFASFKEVRLLQCQIDDEEKTTKFIFSNKFMILVKHEGNAEDIVWFLLMVRDNKALTAYGNGKFVLKVLK